MKRHLMISFAVALAVTTALFAQSNIDNSVPNKYGWGENVGWTNWRDANSAAQGVNVGGFVMSGFIWGENIGWINLSDVTAGKYVSVDAATTPLLCDTNHDGLKNGRDVQSFTWYLLLTLSPNWRDVCSGDVEGSPDQVIDFDDIAPFVDCLLSS